MNYRRVARVRVLDDQLPCCAPDLSKSEQHLPRRGLVVGLTESVQLSTYILDILADLFICLFG